MTRYFKFAIGLLIAFMGISFASAQNVKTYVHPKAQGLVPSFKKELEAYFPDIPQPWYVLGLAEHESCQYLTHVRCMSAASQFTTKWKDGTRREQGAGIAMITRAWKADGTLRMDTLASLKRVYPKELKDLNWDNITQQPGLQARAMVLLLRSDYRQFSEVPNHIERMKFTDSSYNGGARDAKAARKVCGLAAGCDPNIWFDNVEKYSVKSDKALYGNRSPKEINNNHVRDVFLNRMPKYKPLLPALGTK